jgi:predicted DNA-binding ribbon-helix-helix protein
MLRHMRTTVRLDPALMARAKEEAARRGETLTALIERGLRLVLARPLRGKRKPAVRVPVSAARGGMRAGINLENSAALLDAMEGRE